MHSTMYADNLSRQQQKSTESAKICEAYQAYFGMSVGVQGKPWAPHLTSKYCKQNFVTLGNTYFVAGWYVFLKC